jgi:hypothetical protein
MTRKEFIAEVRNVAEGNLYTHNPMSTKQPPIYGWDALEMHASDLYDRLHGAKPQGTAQLYFKDVDSENCFPLEDHLEEAREAGLKKITLLRAVPDFDNKDFIWCTYMGECGDRSECCKAECSYYQPRGNAKGGVCRHRGHLYQHGEEEPFNVE